VGKPELFEFAECYFDFVKSIHQGDGQKESDLFVDGMGIHFVHREATGQCME